MATNLAIDPELLNKALEVGGEKTKKATVNRALQEFIARREMAIVSGKRCAWAGADAGGSAVLCGDDEEGWGDVDGDREKLDVSELVHADITPILASTVRLQARVRLPPASVQATGRLTFLGYDSPEGRGRSQRNNRLRLSR